MKFLRIMDESEIKTIRNKIPKWLKLFFLFCIIFCGLITLTSVVLTYQYQNKIYPGIRVSNFPVGGLTREQAKNILESQFKKIYGPGFNFQYAKTEKNIANENILKLDTEGTLDEALSFGHNQSLWKKHWQIMLLPIFKKNLIFKYSFDKEALRQKISESFSLYEKPAKNSEPLITIVDKTNKTYSLDFSDEESGEMFYVKGGIQIIESALREFNNPTVELKKEIDLPIITKKEAQKTTPQINKILDAPEIVLFYQNKKWPIQWETLPSWLILEKKEEQINLTFKETMLRNYLESISQAINQPAIDAKFQIKDGKVIEFAASQNGQELDLENSYNKILTSIFSDNYFIVELLVKETLPKISMENSNELGIKELLGRGSSNFAGSPNNRRHNIGVGTAALNGIIIKPGEEFSLVKTLGEIDAQNGYLPELVIKKEGTIPEYGGGLCQVATTLFRGVLNSGLKISSRRNHSYRVVYYEPAGTDATIYNPQPDFKFINDTPSNILIQTKLQSDILTYELWGTKDNRIVQFEGLNKVSDIADLKPKIYNIVNPGPALEITTTALKPGEKKQTEKSHAGADAEFDRIITKTDKTVEKETFSSHYIPWRAVFMIGIDPEKAVEIQPEIKQ